MSFFYTTEEKTDRWGDTHTRVRVHVGRIVAAAVLAATGHKKQIAKSLVYDYGKTAIDTNIGYKKAEKKYYDKHR